MKFAFTVWSVFILFCAFTEGKVPPHGFVFALEGRTQGTTYQIKYISRQNQDYQPEIDSILTQFSQSLSTYIPDSEISTFNRSGSFRFTLPYFYPVLVKSREVYEATLGAFDPTVAPLVDAYGFGKNKVAAKALNVDSLLQYVGFDKVTFDKACVSTTQPGVKLDFNAIAQGYSVDVIAEWLEQKGIRHYMIEIGGEVRCQGRNDKGKTWVIGIANPKQATPKERALEKTVHLHNRAMATSGNYRNSFPKEGRLYSHIINPATGLMEQNSLLSVTIFAPDCMTADAFATAFLVMGLEKAQQFLRNHQTLAGCFIYIDHQGNTRIWTSKQNLL